MLQRDHFLKRRPNMRLETDSMVLLVKDPFPITAWEREQVHHLAIIPLVMPIVAAVGLGSIMPEGGGKGPQAISIPSLSAIILNRQYVRTPPAPLAWTFGPSLCHEIAHLQGFTEHGPEMDAAAYQVFIELARKVVP
jgi:hypothetical protein